MMKANIINIILYIMKKSDSYFTLMKRLILSPTEDLVEHKLDRSSKQVVQFQINIYVQLK